MVTCRRLMAVGLITDYQDLCQFIDDWEGERGLVLGESEDTISYSHTVVQHTVVQQLFPK